MSGLEILRTERLALRHLTEDEAPFILELLNERGFIDNIGDRGVRDLDGARRYVTDGPGASYQKYGYGLWLTTLRESGEPIGICGLVKREGLEHADIGYAFLERYWGKGYAVEAAHAVLDHARRVIGLDTIVAITTPGNTASIAVLEKIGLKFARMIKLPSHDSESTYFTT
jgi:ribosomal-protein-alanine N-acetyltransferase